jgi:hypothetical protein
VDNREWPGSLDGDDCKLGGVGVSRGEDKGLLNATGLRSLVVRRIERARGVHRTGESCDVTAGIESFVK